MNFYVAGEPPSTETVDNTLRRKAHSPTVGFLICGSKNEHTVRYAFGRSTSPRAVAAYAYAYAYDQLTAALDAFPDDTE